MIHKQTLNAAGCWGLKTYTLNSWVQENVCRIFKMPRHLPIEVSGSMFLFPAVKSLTIGEPVKLCGL